MRISLNRYIFQTIVLIVIFFLTAFLQFFKFPTNPPSLNWDEAAIGYNAYSIIQTKKDEYGHIFPLTFRSFDDYKMPVYIYLTSGSILLFGYNDFAVRFPSAFFGLLTIIVMYFLTYELTKKTTIALLAALLTAIVPWHLQFSRVAIEANIALFFALIGMLFFLWHKKNKWFMSLSSVCFGIAMFTYLSFPILCPLFILLLIWFCRKDIHFLQTQSLIALLLFLLFTIAALLNVFVFTPNTRFKGTSVLGSASFFDQAKEEVAYDGTQRINLPRRFFHETPLLTNTSLVIRGYGIHFSTDYLFYDLGQKYHYIPGLGLLYIWMIPFILLGIFSSIRKTYGGAIVLFGILFISPIPASVTYDVPHAIRTYTMIIPLIIFCSIGMYELTIFLKRKYLLMISVVLVEIIVIFLSLFYLFLQYQVELPHERSEDWQYGRQQMADYLFANYSKYTKAIISTDLQSPYIFILYYGKYDPKKYLAEGGTEDAGIFSQTIHFNKFNFHQFNFQKDLTTNILFVGTPQDFPTELKPDKIITYLDGTNAVYIVKGEKIQQFINACVIKKLEYNSNPTDFDKKTAKQSCEKSL